MYLIGLAEEQSATGRASKYDSYALDKMSIRVSPKVFGARIRCAHLASCCPKVMVDVTAACLPAMHYASRCGCAATDRVEGSEFLSRDEGAHLLHVYWRNEESDHPSQSIGLMDARWVY